jgi:hypothetical protein
MVSDFSRPRTFRRFGAARRFRIRITGQASAGPALVAKATAREVGRIDLREALELTALVAKHDRVRGQRMAARWRERWLGETAAPMIDEAVMVAGCLAGLGSAAHDEVLVAPRADSSSPPRTASERRAVDRPLARVPRSFEAA